MVYREAHTLLEELGEATLAATRKDCLAELATVPLLIIYDLGMRKLAHTAAHSRRALSFFSPLDKTSDSILGRSTC